MDPNETLKRLRELCQPDATPNDPEGAELSELFLALDEWLSRGGFLPTGWIPANACQAGIDGYLCSRSVHPDSWAHVALTSGGEVRRRWPEPELVDRAIAGWPEKPEPLGPPNPADASPSLLDQLDADLTRAGEVVRRMREGR